MPNIHKHRRSRHPWFRITVPADLRAVFGKREIKISLGDRNPAQAQIEQARLTAEYKAKFAAARAEATLSRSEKIEATIDRYFQIIAGHNYGTDKVLYALQKQVAFALVTAWGRDEFYRFEADLAFGIAPADEDWDELADEQVARIIPEDVREDLVRTLIATQTDRRAFGSRIGEPLKFVMAAQNWKPMLGCVSHVEALTGTDLSSDPVSFETAANLLCQRLIEHQSGLYEPHHAQIYPTFDPKPVSRTVDASARNVTAQIPNLSGIKLSGAFDQWVRIAQPGRSAVTEAGRAVDRFTELNGDLAVSHITKGMVREYRDFIEQMPKGISLAAIRQRGLRLRDAVRAKLASNPTAEKLAPGSVKKDIGALAAIFGVAVDEDQVEHNPAADIRVSGYSKKRTRQRNPTLPMTAVMMRDLFATPLFTGCQGGSPVQWTRPDKEVHQNRVYWTFLLSAVSGARPSELAQVLTDDVVILEQEKGLPIVAILITGMGDDQSAKTDESIRAIVVHPNIVELGFLDFVETRRAGGEKRLFDYTFNEKQESFKASVSRDLNRYIDRTLTEARTIKAYSLRHEFADRSRVSLDEETSRGIMGHAKSRTYGIGAPLAFKAAELAKLPVDFVDWAKLAAAAKLDPKNSFIGAA